MSVSQETALLEKAGNQANETKNSKTTYETTTLTSTTTTTISSTTKVHSAIVKSTDGKFHQLNFDINQRTLEFILLKGENHPTKHILLVNLKEVLSIGSSNVKLSSALPYPLTDSSNVKEGDPNVLYVYYTFRQNVYNWRVRQAVIVFSTTTEKKLWLGLLQTALKEITNRPKKVLIFINPFGGKGRANQIYTKQVEPIFDLAGIEREVVKTNRANHAYDILKELNEEDWQSLDGFISVGGDGLFNEILSSAIIRTQEENRKDIADPNIDSLVTPRVRFGIIGAGSANSIVSSVHGVDDCPTAAIHIAIGSQCAVDVCTVHEEDSLLRISANAISYGWLGDVLHDSENYRCIGPVRYQYSALRTTIRHPTYFGRVSFALSTINKEPQTKPIKLPSCTKSCELCNGQKSETNYPYHWQTDFTHVICCVIPCVSPFTPYGLAPYAGVGDGSMDLALVPKVSRCQNLNIMRKVSMYGGKDLIRLQNDLHVYRVSRWKFTPAAILVEKNPEIGEIKKQGAWNLDGEILPQPEKKSLLFRLHPQLIKYFGRELDLDDPKYEKCNALCCKKPKKYSKLVVVG